MNGVFAEECGGLLLGQRAGVSPQPADLSTAAVFMLRLVPQLSLPVVLPVFLFPNSSSNSPSSPSFQFQFLYAAVSFFQSMIHAAYMPQGFLTVSLLKYSKICHVGQPHDPKCDAQCTYAHLRTLLRIHLYSLPLFFQSGPCSAPYKLSMHAIVYIINCEVMTS